MVKLFFYLVNLIFIVFYLYPGSILGKIIYGNFKKQPQLTNDFTFSIVEISSNHIYAFALISFLGLYIYFKKYLKQIMIYLFFISIFLEILHIIIPYRSFEFSDLIGNFLGVFITLILFYTYHNAKKYFS
tara:strand:+ start:340 stop:729 length:390 start_codon:yes stop_codon:yes gene_type:complete